MTQFIVQDERKDFTSNLAEMRTWHDKNGLKLDRGGSCTAFECAKCTGILSLTWLTLCYVNFTSIL